MILRKRFHRRDYRSRSVGPTVFRSVVDDVSTGDGREPATTWNWRYFYYSTLLLLLLAFLYSFNLHVHTITGRYLLFIRFIALDRLFFPVASIVFYL
jgi:hypothetical protein